MQSLQENVFEEFDAIGFEPHIKNGWLQIQTKIGFFSQHLDP
jgi:hypothetical protein